jgi:hypothetical protein
MPPRALWKGSISFGLVTVPINLVSATEPREALAFNLLHRKDRSRIVEKRFCAKENVEVSWKDIVKGYQFAKDQYVVVTDEDFAKVRVPATQTFDIRRFVPADALRATGKLAIGTIVLRQREHLAALEPVGAALVLTTMRYAHEIRRQKDLDLPASGKGWTDSEMKLARQLIETLAGEWNPDEAEPQRWAAEARQSGRCPPARTNGSGRLADSLGASDVERMIDQRLHASHEADRMGQAGVIYRVSASRSSRRSGTAWSPRDQPVENEQHHGGEWHQDRLGNCV